jgi:hypothetical protein
MPTTPGTILRMLPTIDLRYACKVHSVRKRRRTTGWCAPGLLMTYTRRDGVRSSAYLRAAVDIAAAEFLAACGGSAPRPGPGGIPRHLDRRLLAHLGVTRQSGKILESQALSHRERALREYALLAAPYRRLMNAEKYVGLRRQCRSLRCAANARGQRFDEAQWWADTITALQEDPHEHPSIG